MSLNRLLAGSLAAVLIGSTLPVIAVIGVAAADDGVHVRGPRPVPPPSPFDSPDVVLAQPKLSRAAGQRIRITLPVRFAAAPRSRYEVQVMVRKRLADNGAPRGIARRITTTGKVTGSRQKLAVTLPRAVSRRLTSQGLSVPVKRGDPTRNPARLVQVLVRQTIQNGGSSQLLTAGDDVARPGKQASTTAARRSAKAQDVDSDSGGRVSATAADGNNIVYTYDSANNSMFVGHNIPVKVTVSSGTGDELQVTTFPVACMTDEAVTGLVTTFDSVSDSASGTATVLGGNPVASNQGTLDLAGLADGYNSWLSSGGDGARNIAVLGGMSPSLSQFYFGQTFPFSGQIGTSLQQALDAPGFEVAAPVDASGTTPTLTNGAGCGNQITEYNNGFGQQVFFDPNTYDMPAGYFGSYSYGWQDGAWDPPDPYVDPAYFFIQVTDIDPTSAAGTSFLSGLISIQPADQWMVTGSSDGGQQGFAGLYQPEIYAQFVPIAAGNPGGGGSYACATVTIPDTLDNGAVGVGIQYNLDSGDPTTETTDKSGSTCQK